MWQPEPGKFVPGLATSWQVTPDATRFTFTLREGVKFHDGTPCNAAAVKATFDRIVDPQLKALLIGQLGPYDGTDVLGDYQVRVRFKEPYPLFLHYLSSVALRPVSPAGVKKWGADFGQNLVGTGPFALTKFTPAEITFERFADYNWAPAFLDHKGPAYLDKVVLRFVPESSTRLIALERGESQLVDFVPDADVKRFRADQKFVVDVIPVPGLPQLLQLNVTKPPLDDKRVRQAIQYAVDQKKLCDVLFFGVRRPGYGVLASSTPGYWKGVEEAYKFSPDKAKALLDAAGWKVGAGGIREKGGEKLSLLYITTNRAEYTQAGEVVQDMLKQVGIEMKIDAMSNAASPHEVPDERAPRRAPGRDQLRSRRHDLPGPLPEHQGRDPGQPLALQQPRDRRPAGRGRQGDRPEEALPDVRGAPEGRHGGGVHPRHVRADAHQRPLPEPRRARLRQPGAVLLPQDVVEGLTRPSMARGRRAPGLGGRRQRHGRRDRTETS